ncbi:MAG: bifunctional riboflavin kinase/FAD synthetase [Thermodesulfobacteriota bacterium]
MDIYRSLAEISRPFHEPSVTIGNFDGVHLGHQTLFAEVVSRAFRSGGAGVAITFHPHPLQVVRPDRGVKLISSFEQKVEMITLAGINALVVIPFTREFAAMSAQDFVDRVLVGTVGVKDLVVGYDYAFGRGRQGDIPFLRAQGAEKGFSVSVVEPFYVDGMLVSSTKIRELVAEGRMREVGKLLGRPYQIRGTVRMGKRRGGPVVGFPTANLQILEEDLCPRHGVYVTQVVLAGRCYGGVMNIGYNPTFGDQELSAETHIFDFDGDLYGHRIKLNLLEFLRPERKFAGPAELAAQIQEDSLLARRILGNAQKELLLACADPYNR